MENYTFNFEVRRMILHFMSAIDGGIVKRYDKDHNVKDSIKVNYIYGPKERIYKDLIDKAEHIKLPIVSVMLTGIQRDNDRVKDNLIGRYENLLEHNKAKIKQIPAPVPVNLTFEVSILAKYQMDMDQLLTNFIPYSDPYFVVSWQEPFTKHEIRSEVRWNGDIQIENPKDLSPTDPYQNIVANTSFEFKGYMFKDRAVDVGKICKIDTDYIITNNFYCDYDTLVARTSANTTEHFVISGAPKVKKADPTVIKTGSTMSACSGIEFTIDDYDPEEIIGRTEHLTIQGWFPNINEVFLSASDPNMFNQSMSSFDIFPDNDNYAEFQGIIIEKFTLSDNIINFNLPVFKTGGYVDVIVVNSCGYSKLSEDREVKDSCCENPYAENHYLYNAWNRLQDPFVNGIEVVQTNYSCTSSITLLATVEGKIIKTLGDFFLTEV